MDFTYEESKQSADAQCERKQVILNYALRCAASRESVFGRS
ncbi:MULTISPECIES: hypothetical protein [Bacillus]|nr:hypothetical protein [Bacillus glycinifermentans]